MRALAALALVLCACGTPAPAPKDTTHGPDQALIADCNGCHAEVAARWAQGPSHALLLDCRSCHEELSATPGKGHQSSRACGDCHSAQAHRALDCATCHEPHGSANLFLVREDLDGHPVHFTRAEGASPDGLLRFGVAGQQAGTGVCEVCHLATRYARAAGDGAAHETQWCGACHTHEKGFSP